MKDRLLKRLFGVGALVVSGAMLLGTSPAGANQFSPPYNTAPGFFTTQGVNVIRTGGSETTYYVMAKLGDLYTQTSIYGCGLSTDNRTCVSQLDGAATTNKDDYSRSEFDNGLGVGTGGGLKALCDLGGGSLSGNPPLNFSRGSRSAASTEQGNACPGTASPVSINGVSFSTPNDLAFADDGVPALVFPFTGQSAISGGTATQIGPVSNGWVPGDPLNCGTGGTAAACTNNPLGTSTKAAGPPNVDISNLPLETGANASVSSVAFRLFCTSTTGNADPLINKITDWGQLTDPTPTSNQLMYTDAHGNQQTITLTKGQEGIGNPIGVPVYLPQVNTGSGTENTFRSFACGSTQANGALNHNSDPTNLAQENDAPQIADIGGLGGAGTAAYMAGRVPSTCTGACATEEANAFLASAPANDPVYQSNLVASTIYYISNGVSLWEPFTKTGGRATGAAQGKLTTVDFIPPGVTNEVPGCQLPTCFPIATKRQLHMFANPLELTASTLGFLNWICASDASAAHHGVDATTGKTYSQEINANISSVFNFPREDCTTTANGTPAGSLSLVPTVRTLSGGNTTAGSSLVTVTTGTGTGDAIRPGDVGAAVSGAGIPSGARIGNVVDQTSFTILVNGTPTGATATGSGVALTVDMTNE